MKKKTTSKKNEKTDWIDITLRILKAIADELGKKK